MVNPGPNFVFTVAVFPGFHSYLSLAPNFWPWSTNGWSLDHIVTDCYVVRDSDGAIFTSDVFIQYVPPAGAAGSALAININGNGAPYLDGGLPPRNVPYWLPDL
jgi:hypothetical protein